MASRFARLSRSFAHARPQTLTARRLALARGYATQSDHQVRLLFQFESDTRAEVSDFKIDDGP